VAKKNRAKRSDFFFQDKNRKWRNEPKEGVNENTGTLGQDDENENR
jgi:hypothetical protein